VEAEALRPGRRSLVGVEAEVPRGGDLVEELLVLGFRLEDLDRPFNPNCRRDPGADMDLMAMAGANWSGIVWSVAGHAKRWVRSGP